MTYFPDLSPYTFLQDDTGALNVGWLDAAVPFPVGPSGDLFIEKPAWACARGEVVQQTRGVHSCNICEPLGKAVHSIQTAHATQLLGSAEIRIGSSLRFAAPDLIIHYVSDHSYQPPAPFAEAVLTIENRLPKHEWTIVRQPW